MSHTDTEQTSRRGRRHTGAEQTQSGEQPTEPTEPTEPADAEKEAAKLAAEQAEAEQIASVQGFTVTEPGEFRTATTPIRNRKPVQQAMDAVAAQAYSDWVAAERPSTWSRMPVITYFLDPDEVAKYRTLIRKACLIVTAEPFEKDGKTIEPSGVRARFGKEFVLQPKQAEKIGKPDEAGKTVLAWAAIDKRHVANGDS